MHGLLATTNTLRCALAFVALAAVVACSGGGSPSSPSQGALASGKLVLTFPSKTSAAGRAERLFVSPSAQSVSISVTGIAQAVVANLSATSPDCTTVDGTRSCAIVLEAPIGTDTFIATLYGGPNATGTVLGIGTAVEQIAPGSPFSLSVSVSGNAATITLTAARTTFTAGTPATTTITVSAFDAGGNLIVGSYSSPITLTDSDTTGTFTIAPTTVTNSSTVVTLTYSGGTGATSATISASGTNIPVTSVSTQTVTVVPPSPTPSPLPTASPQPIPSPTQIRTSTPPPTASPIPLPQLRSPSSVKVS